MQVTPLCLDWNDVQKRGSSQQILDEMICTDDVDIYAKEFPTELWSSDSAMQHFSTAEILALAIQKQPENQALKDVASLISTGNSIDELGLSSLSDGVYFISLSPTRVSTLLRSFQSIDPDSISDVTLDAKEWILQWKSLLEFAGSKGFGIIGSCG